MESKRQEVAGHSRGSYVFTLGSHQVRGCHEKLGTRESRDAGFDLVISDRRRDLARVGAGSSGRVAIGLGTKGSLR